MSKLNELLKEKGFDDNEVKGIVECINQSLEYMPKAEWNKVNEEKKSLEQQLSERDKQFKELEKNFGDKDEDFKKQLEDMKKERDTAKAEANARIKSWERKTNCIKLFGEKVHDPEDVFSKLNLDSITFNDKNEPVAGLDDQITKLKETHGYYFKPDGDGEFNTHKPDGSNGGNQKKTGDDEATYVETYLFPDKK